MRILFVLHYPGYLRYFDSVMAELARRGHQVHVVFESVHKQREGLLGLPSHPLITHGEGFPRGSTFWQPLARDLRQVTDYVNYLHPRFSDSHYLRDRVALRLPRWLRPLGRLDRLPAPVVTMIVRALHALEGALPVEPDLRAFLERDGADVLIASPLITVGSRQPDLVVAAKSLGLPAVLAVASWDHLTTKGTVRAPVDRIFVWNGIQRDEAVDVHGVAPDRLTVTGAQPFDKWFTQPVTPKAAFAERVGLPADRPWLLFVGSTKSISAPDAEVAFVRAWLARLRASDEQWLRDAAVLVRPHPYGGDKLRHATFDEFGAVSVFPRGEANPVDADDRRDYFDSLANSDAVVGINTSAMIEAGIAGRPVFSVQVEDFAATQAGTLHFRYLLPENGGFVHSATTLDEHVVQLSCVLKGDEAGELTQAFVERFVRPHGLDVPATSRFADAVEAVAADLSAARRRTPTAGIARALLGGLATARAAREPATVAKGLHRAAQQGSVKARARAASTRSSRVAARLKAVARALDGASAEYEAIVQAQAKVKAKTEVMSKRPNRPDKPAKPGKPKAPKPQTAGIKR